MATRNIVPRATCEGALGTTAKKWGSINVNAVNTSSCSLMAEVFQSGAATVTNKGVISGCTVTKSTTSIRSVNLAAGKVFANGMIIPMPQKDACAVIPSNSSGSSETCYVYIAQSSGNWEVFCTALGESVPSSGIPLYMATVPNNNTEITDPYLQNVTLTSVRRLEPDVPMAFASSPFVLVALPRNMASSDYIVTFDTVSYSGSEFQLGRIFAADKATNGFKVYVNGMVDNVQVRWYVSKLNL
jgi:hypothetical protein